MKRNVSSFNVSFLKSNEMLIEVLVEQTNFERVHLLVEEAAQTCHQTKLEPARFGGNWGVFLLTPPPPISSNENFYLPSPRRSELVSDWLKFNRA